MILRGPGFYDDAELFDTYIERRHRTESANNTLEEPIIRELLGQPQGLRILDLGCGDATYGRELLAAGCQSYIGLDGSANMIAKAKETLQGTTGELIHGTIEAWQPTSDSFDLITSRLVLHYIEDLASTLRVVYRCLAQGGRFVFSVEHPVMLSHNESLEQSGRRGSWIVDNYFKTGQRQQLWMGGHVVKYHRTVEDYFKLLQDAGFQIESLRESKPVRENFSTDEEFERRSRIPVFLFFAGKKA